MRNVNKLAALTGLMAITLLQFSSAAAEGVAESGADNRAVVVQYDDLDLTRDAGVQALYRRLQNAAERVCGSYDVHVTRTRQAWIDCVETTMTRAVDELGRTKLAALHASKS